MVIGLGNPGPDYADHRHNIGFMVVDELARRARASTPKTKMGAEIADAVLAGEKTLLLKPMEFMNTSGEAAGRVAQFFKIPPASCVAVYDELDLPFGRLKLGTGGSAAGHNGVKSLLSHLGSDFLRVRVGIDRPAPGRGSANYVLANFSRVEQKELPFVIAEAADAVEAVLRDGLARAMNKFNTKKPAQDATD